MKISVTKDVEVITTLCETVQSLHAKLHPDIFKPFNYLEIKNFFEKVIAEDRFTFLLLEDKGNPVGYAMIEMREHKENPFKHSYQSIYVHQISVIENSQRKGYGTLLMNEVYRIAKENTINRVELDYWTKNEHAKNFYQKHGFTKFHEAVYKVIYKRWSHHL